MEQARRTPFRDFFFSLKISRELVDEFLPSVNESGHSEIEIRFRNFRDESASLDGLQGPETGRRKAVKTIAFATVSRDITDRKRLEDNPRKLASDLSWKRTTARTSFSPRWRTSLQSASAPLRTTLEVLKRSGGSLKEVPHALETMERQLKQLVRLVDDLLDLNQHYARSN